MSIIENEVNYEVKLYNNCVYIGFSSLGDLSALLLCQAEHTEQQSVVLY